MKKKPISREWVIGHNQSDVANIVREDDRLTAVSKCCGEAIHWPAAGDVPGPCYCARCKDPLPNQPSRPMGSQMTTVNRLSEDQIRNWAAVWLGVAAEKLEVTIG